MENSDSCIDCYKLYSVYGEERVKGLKRMHCAWCGQTDRTKIKHASSVPDRFGHYDFCIARNDAKKGCFAKYGDFVYNRDLSEQDCQGALSTGVKKLKFGLPFYITGLNPDKNSEVMLKCDYCGDRASDVITNVCMPKGYHHKNFCRNNKCCFAYCKYVDFKRDMPKTPAVFRCRSYRHK